MKLTPEQFEALEMWILAKIDYALSDRGPWSRELKNAYRDRAREVLVEDKEPDASL